MLSTLTASLLPEERVVPRHFDEMPGVVHGQEAGVPFTADLEAVDPAVRGDEPGRLDGLPGYRPDHMQGQVTDGAGVAEDRDIPSLVG